MRFGDAADEHAMPSSPSTGGRSFWGRRCHSQAGPTAGLSGLCNNLAYRRRMGFACRPVEQPTRGPSMAGAARQPCRRGGLVTRPNRGLLAQAPPQAWMLNSSVQQVAGALARGGTGLRRQGAFQLADRRS